MPENMNSLARKSIHGNRDSRTPQRKESAEYNENTSESLEQFTSESGSDFEDNDTNIEEESKRRFELSRSVPRTPQRPKLTPVNVSPKPTYKPEKPMQRKEVVANGSRTSLYSLVYILAAAILASMSFYFFVKAGEKNCYFEKLQEQYPQEGKLLWRSLKVGIECILNKRTQTPAVYLFTHHGGEHVFQLVKDIAAHSSSCFGQTMHPVEIESDDFIVASNEDNDYGHVIEKYKAKIKKGNVILIANLNEIPAEAARALHFICDTYSPIAKDVVIFLTLTVPRNEEVIAVLNAENTLNQLWGPKLERNELDPLITRVTDQVIALQS